MKKLNVMLLAAVFAISSVATASTKPTESETNFTQEIKELLKKPSFKVENEIEASVTFTLNNEGEIVVLSIDSDSDMVKGYIKNRLNYQKIEAKPRTGVKFYTMPVRVVAS
ncbi:hypothetical protein SAMN04487910_2261 [Aquimarina amphilecti]|uniref:TonB protein C-terminal n=1 Tax=Aquimarina amphilecti TaxID=1038014 RepID=A0A1H7PNV5_AQUAM|nr:hypothetical protein [Aquimarina amphilecti]SEL37084.1 hypothetical protein SAMN04487910_2261 [Aquimarina amphilecti]